MSMMDMLNLALKNHVEHLKFCISAVNMLFLKAGKQIWFFGSVNCTGFPMFHLL